MASIKGSSGWGRCRMEGIQDTQRTIVTFEEPVMFESIVLRGGQNKQDVECMCSSEFSSEKGMFAWVTRNDTQYIKHECSHMWE
jgi:hypothetical protein